MISSQNALFILFASLKKSFHLDRRTGSRRAGGNDSRVHVEVLLRGLLVVVAVLGAVESNRSGPVHKVLGVDGINGHWLVMVMSVVTLVSVVSVVFIVLVVLVTMLFRRRAAAAEKETSLFDAVVHGVGGNDHRQDGQGAECYDEFHSHQLIGLYSIDYGHSPAFYTTLHFHRPTLDIMTSKSLQTVAFGSYLRPQGYSLY